MKIIKQELQLLKCPKCNRILGGKATTKKNKTTLINFGKYKIVMFAMAKLMEMETTEQNKVELYLFNNISEKLRII